ncbi:MAG: RimK family alpha-L-glutamate ligase [Nevskiales bacterium]|nr:RimK family alpha-L-glutamate ligase [Nevskiales bacterium]
MTGLVVVDRLADWPDPPAEATVITAADYLTDDRHAGGGRRRVYNLCDSYRYQSAGYYVSLLAGARGHQPLPDITTVQDLKGRDGPRVFRAETDDLVQTSLAPLESDSYELDVYFGRCQAKRHARLARALFNLFPAPLIRARFKRQQRWEIVGLSAIALDEVAPGQRAFMQAAASDYFAGKRPTRKRVKRARYDLAILHNPAEKEPPSNPKALKLFRHAAEDLGFGVEMLERSDFGRLLEFDALFIRETTAVNHHSYRFARRAAQDDLVVIDDPDSILRCTNKVWLAQRMTRAGVPTPQTLILHRGNLKDVAEQIGFPCVLKQPDSAFSRGVVKIDDEAELRRVARELLERSDLLVVQAFVSTEYDWRIGVLGGQPLYACRYFMAPSHWQIIKRDEAGKQEGDAETLPIDAVPTRVLDVAMKAAATVGKGLYGVDLKQFGKRVALIEVNDNPSIDAGVEDQVLGNDLYRIVMQHMLDRLDERTRRQ